MQLFDSEAGTYELVIISNENTKNTAAVYHNLPNGPSEFRAKDLFVRHSKKTELFRYYGRKDDIVTLSNGEKFNPIPLELDLQTKPSLKGVLVIGNGRPHTALLLEFKDPDNTSLGDVWPLIQKSNTLVPTQGRIHWGMVIIASPNIPFIRSEKGSIIRRLTEEAYHTQVEKLYTDFQDIGIQISLRTDPQTLKYELTVISTFLRHVVSVAFPSAINIEDDQDFYSLCLDSTQTIMIVSGLKRALEARASGSYDWITPRTLFQNPTIGGLSQLLHGFLNHGIIPNKRYGSDDVVPAYVMTLPDTPIQKPCRIAVIGSTGALGVQIIATMLRDPGIVHIYCLNRSTGAQKRQEDGLMKLDEGAFRPLFHKLKYFHIELGKPRLALTDDQYEQVVTSVDAIIFNAWKVDFVHTVRSFHPFLHALVEVVKIASDSARRMSILFVSSLSSVARMTTVGAVPEALIEDPSAAINMGYAQSKLAGERILAAASRKCGVPVCVARVCQLIGRDAGSAGSDRSWLTALIESAKTLKSIPADVAAIDWLHMDVAARMICDILGTRACDEAQFYHATHPEPQPWGLLVDTLRERVDGAEVVPLRDWVDKLKSIENPTLEDMRTVPALTMLDFFDDLASKPIKTRYATARSASASSARIPRIDGGFIESWLGDWRM
ncbi:putative ochratoxin a non-ribosomal peptide synthetase protein [Rosellinia necatrix]|uniref:Putative ochratoxin a non-ribosomal peptide synthetase protein n=1 Tax=Rosellinia necatrix TaxID=77044 RepID=A0A1W2TQD4_ROSNE|nr:putative ochratoxin a non-ribosomal peptide synthetase protein [Rosellinia necatrix]